MDLTDDFFRSCVGLFFGNDFHADVLEDREHGGVVNLGKDVLYSDSSGFSGLLVLLVLTSISAP